MGKYKREFMIYNFDADKDGIAKPESLLTYMGETSSLHSDSLGVGIEELRRNDYGWILNRWKVKFSRYPKVKDKITIETWTSGLDKFYATREFVIYDDNKEGGLPRSIAKFLGKDKIVREIKIAMLGFGNVGKAFSKLLISKHKEIISKYKYDIKVVAISTASRGSMVNKDGLDLELILRDIEDLGSFNKDRLDYFSLDSMEIAGSVDYDLLIKLTPLILSGQPAIDHIRYALNRKKHAITANKGPIN